MHVYSCICKDIHIGTCIHVHAHVCILCAYVMCVYLYVKEGERERERESTQGELNRKGWHLRK